MLITSVVILQKLNFNETMYLALQGKNLTSYSWVYSKWKNNSLICSTCYLCYQKVGYLFCFSHAKFEISCSSENFLNTSYLKLPHTSIYGFVYGGTNEFLRDTNFYTAGELKTGPLCEGTSVLIVAQFYHLLRSLEAFRYQGLQGFL